MDNYSKLIERICKSSGLEKEEIERKVEAKKAKLSGLISKEGAAQIVAAELGINFDNERLSISEIVEGMKRVNVVGKVIKLNPIRSFNKNGREGKVASMTLADDSANIRVVLWDTNHISLVENGKIGEGSVIELSSGNVRNGEVHMSSFADIKISKEKIDNVVVETSFGERKLNEVKPGDNFQTRAIVVNAFEPRYFEVCPKCGKRALENECKEHGNVEPLKRALLNIVVDDGTETMRGVIFGDQIKNLGLTDEQIFSIDEYNKVKNNILGEEKVFTGQVRNNSLYNTIEFTINNIADVNMEDLIKELESKTP